MEPEATNFRLYSVLEYALDSLNFKGMNLGNRAADILISPSELHENALMADVCMNDIPMELISSIVKMDDIDLDGMVRVKASIDGLPAQMDISAEVLPVEISATYKPYDIQFSLGETPIIMNHNGVRFEDFRIYCANNSYLSLTGGLDVGKMQLDIALAADHFSPVKLEQGGPFPVYGNLETNI